MRNLIRSFLIITGFSLISLPLKAQTDDDAIRPFYNEFGPGARAMALGGAFSAVAEDYTATYWNPAGLAQIKKMEFHIGLGRNTVKNNLNYYGTTTDNSAGFTNINSVGFVFPFPTSRGSLVFAIGYNRIDHFSDYNKLSGIAPLDNFGNRLSQKEETSVEGSLNSWTFSGAVDISPNVSIGGSLNLLTGSKKPNIIYNEIDLDDTLDFYSRDVTFNLNQDYTGVSFKMGALAKVNPDLRLALTVTTPSYLSVEENDNTYEEILGDNDTTDAYSDEGYRKYSIHSPWRFEFGASYKIKMFLFTGSVELVDWTETNFHSNILDDGRNIDGEINNNIRSNYRQSFNYSLGSEFIVPRYGFKISGGYRYQSSPLKPSVEAVASDRQYLSGGLSFLLDKQVKVDLGYQYGWWKQSTTDGFLGTDMNGNDLTVSESVKNHRLLVSLSYRF